MDGNISQVFYNNQVRSRILKFNVDETKDYYNAIKLFDDIAMKFKIEHKLESGKKLLIKMKGNS